MNMFIFVQGCFQYVACWNCDSCWFFKSPCLLYVTVFFFLYYANIPDYFWVGINHCTHLLRLVWMTLFYNNAHIILIGLESKWSSNWWTNACTEWRFTDVNCHQAPGLQGAIIPWWNGFPVLLPFSCPFSVAFLPLLFITCYALMSMCAHILIQNLYG